MKIGLIPCRLESQRLPNKPLKIIEGLPMFSHVYLRSKMSNLDEVFICTDSKKIQNQAKLNGINVILTSKRHLNGTERCAEASEILSLNDNDVIIDIQGDEPLVNPNHINSVINNFKPNKMDVLVPHMITNEKNNKNIVKIVNNDEGRILYMSRADVPFGFNKNIDLKKHLSIIAFNKKSIIKFSSLPESSIEKIERIELLRAIENNLNVFTFNLEGLSRAVDTIEDLNFVRTKMKNDEFFKLYK